MPRLIGTSPAQTAVHTKRYSSFNGVDFSADPSQVDTTRSPWAVNVIADGGGCPQKRPGWRKLAQAETPVRGIHRYETDYDERYIVHAGSKLYSWQGGEDTPEEIMSGLTGEYSDAFMWKDKLYILTGAEYIYAAVDEESGEVTGGYVRDIAYVPVTRYDTKTWHYKSPDDPVIGVDYDATNLVTKRRRNNFIYEQKDYIPDTEERIVFFLDKEVDRDATLEDLKLETEQGNVIDGVLKFGSYSSVASEWYGMDAMPAVGDVTCLVAGLWELRTALKNLGDTSGMLYVTYPAQPEDEELAERIPKCHIHSFFNNRLFVAGNPEHPNADFYSELNEPTYFKEINYTEIGNSDILGYLKTGEQLAIIKESSLQDVGVYLRRAEFDSSMGYYFPVRQGVTGTGALGFGGCAALVDDPLYLTDTGVMGIIADNISGERVIQQRSTRVNNKLLREPGLENAICTAWNGYLLVAVNGNVYLADSRQRTYARNIAGNYEYEWFYWDNIPASCVTPVGDTFYFGTADGKLCRMNTDMLDERGEVSMDAYADYPEGLGGEAAAIVADWSTKFDDDGDFMLKKNMVRRGSGIFLKASRRGNVKILIRTDRELERVLAYRRRGVFDFNDLSFENFTFETMPRLVAAANKKVKKYTAIQVICRSDDVKSDFGILGIERRFVTGYFNK